MNQEQQQQQAPTTSSTTTSAELKLTKGFIFATRKGSTKSGLHKYDYCVKTVSASGRLLIMTSFQEFTVIRRVQINILYL